MRFSSYRSESGNLAELPPALVIALLFVCFPLINLIGIVLSMGAVAVLSFQCATTAAQQPTYDDALQAMCRDAEILRASGLLQFLKVRPEKGYQNCGEDLYVRAESFRGGADMVYGPNTPVPPPIDTTSYLYECCVHSTYQVSPWINMASVPLIGGVPGLGKPVTMRFSADRNAERPAGLEGNGASFTQPQVGFVAPPPVPSDHPIATAIRNGDWNYPNIYQLIEQTGQTVVSTDIIIVRADNPNLTMTSINVAANQTLWFDFRSDGQWAAQPSWPAVTADGYPPYYMGLQPNTVNVDGNGQPFNYGVLLGKLTNSPYFQVGSQLSTPAPGQGALGLMMNNAASAYPSSSGQQIVRVVVASR